jgi:hypothetical protein
LFPQAYFLIVEKILWRFLQVRKDFYDNRTEAQKTPYYFSPTATLPWHYYCGQILLATGLSNHHQGETDGKHF